MAENTTKEQTSFWTPENVRMLSAYLTGIGSAIADPNQSVAGNLDQILNRQIAAANFEKLLAKYLGEDKKTSKLADTGAVPNLAGAGEFGLGSTPNPSGYKPNTSPFRTNLFSLANLGGK